MGLCGALIWLNNRVYPALRNLWNVKEIFENLMLEAIARHQHPDIVARVYAGMMDVEHEFFKWAERERENDRNEKRF